MLHFDDSMHLHLLGTPAFAWPPARAPRYLEGGRGGDLYFPKLAGVAIKKPQGFELLQAQQY